MQAFSKAFKMHIRGWGGVQGQESPSTSEVTIQETLGNTVHVSGKMSGKKGYESGKSQGKVREKGLGILADTLIEDTRPIFGPILLVFEVNP